MAWTSFLAPLRPPGAALGAGLGALAVLAGLACGAGPAPTSAGFDATNLVLVVVDTLRADALSCYGAAQATPNIDALARGGVRFSRAYSHIPITGPSHATMFTGLLPAEHGFHNNPQVLAQEHLTLAERLQSAGWNTAAFVSLGVLKKRHGLDQGFAVYGDRFRRDWFKSAAGVNREVEAWLEQGQAEPFFLFVHYSEPHEPYTPVGLSYPRIAVDTGAEPETEIAADGSTYAIPLEVEPGASQTLYFDAVDGDSDQLFEFRKLRVPKAQCEVHPGAGFERNLRRFGAAKFMSRLPAELEVHCSEVPPEGSTLHVMVLEDIDVAETRRRYALEVQEVDRQLGRLMALLDTYGLRETSLVVLTADHGESLGEHDFIGHVTQLYEPLVHVPLIFDFPGTTDAVTPVQATARHRDLVPTVLDLFELEKAPELAGRSLMPLIRGLDSSSRPSVSTTYRPEARHNRSALIRDGFKLIATEKPSTLELYALNDDPDELHDLAHEDAERTRKMAEELRQILQNAAGEAAAEAELDADDIEQLRALGYVQ